MYFSARGLVVVLLLTLSCVAQEILRCPESTTVFVNQPAVFTCETRGGITLWRVNGTQREILLPDILRDLVISEGTTPEGVLVTKLTIPARAQYNGTIVQCLSVIIDVSRAESDNATLTIQGPPRDVPNLSATSNASSVTISWTAPFSLDVTGVDPDIWYSVLIYNVTDENNPTAILCTDCINITETHYTFTPDYLSPCHVYNFSVIPLNGAGQEESSDNVTTCMVFDSGNVSLTIGIAVSSKSFCSVNLNFLGLGSVCHPILREANKSFSDIHVVGDEQVFLFLMLPENERYFTYLSIRKGWISATIAHLYFTTYDVQSVSVEEEEGEGVLVRGEFMSGSRATGCLVVLQGPPSSPDVFRALLRTQSQDTLSTTVPVPPSTYTVYGYDLEENGLPNTMPAVVLESQLTISKGATLVKSSQLLKDATITSQLGSTIVIDCEFSEVHPEASCLLVYSEYGSPLLTVVELSQHINFPVSITVDSPENYTFALFGKDSKTGIEEEPVICIKFDKAATPLDMTLDSEKKEETESERDGKNNSQTQHVAIAIGGAVLICVLSCASAVLVFVTVRWYRNKKIKDKTADPSVQTRNAVVYDEVVLPPTSSSVIPTEPNTAYVTTNCVSDYYHTH